MALRINCSSSLFLLPRAPHSNSFDFTKYARLSQKEGEGGSWRDRGRWRWRCALGLASLILAIEVSDVFVGGESCQAVESAAQVVESRSVKKPRWSERRKCDPWRSKSFEMIVPENLPRPSQRRKWEAISLFPEVEINAPEIQVNNPHSKIGSNNCFSL